MTLRQSLEQRLFDLLHPFRDECFTNDYSPRSTEERKALILCENIAFVIRHCSQTCYGKIEPDNVLIAARNWDSMIKGIGPAGVGVFIIGDKHTHALVRCGIQTGESVVDKFTIKVDETLLDFFSGILSSTTFVAINGPARTATA